MSAIVSAPSMSGMESAPWWVVAIFLVLGFGVPAAGTEKAATLPGILGAGGRWWQGRKARRRAEAVEEAQAAAELSASERVADKEIKRLEAAYGRLAKDCEERATQTEARVDELERRITTSERRFYILLGYHRRVADSHLQHAPGVPLPDVPPELVEFLG
ncbi:hypothetical protein JVX90_00390 [Gordonia sp. PDNC005]|uniref:hypothetical protein n=1 Tax=Gordonia sp. PDNC005 TaxID=2811424 RepID=UPI0019635B16|nr:hypothetical protein [Gordonia sp. PDNC005]QRY62771.1 hypothetical protein JVX90_00390 [Gordonia sp. PDNC005]